MNLATLSNEEVLSGLHTLVGQGRVLLARLLAHLGEVEERRLDLESACSSLFDFCVRRLGMGEDEACRRVAAARLVRRFPLALGMIELGEIHLTALLLLCEHMTEENHEELLGAARGLTKSEVQHLVATRFPRPDAPSQILPLAAPTAPSLRATDSNASACAAAASLPGARTASRVEPLSPERYKVQFTASVELREKLERAANLMRHRSPSGELAVVVERAIDLLLAKLEKERLGKTTSRGRHRGVTANAPCDRAPDQRTPDGGTSDDGTPDDGTPDDGTPDDGTRDTRRETKPEKKTRPGYVPRAVRREVFERDGERCTYVDETGRRCESRTFLELDHRVARALGGADDATNVRVRCRAHNGLSAERDFGRRHIEKKKNERSTRPRQRGYDHETSLVALRRLGFKDAEARRALGIVEERWSGAPPPIETVLREALSVLT